MKQEGKQEEKLFSIRNSENGEFYISNQDVTTLWLIIFREIILNTEEHT